MARQVRRLRRPACRGQSQDRGEHVELAAQVCRAAPFSNPFCQRLKTTRASATSAWCIPPLRRTDLTHLFGLLSDGVLTAEIAARYPLAEVAAAMELAESSGRTALGKIILVP